MTVYLDVGAKRIQAYLARTPRLRGRRGASALLDHDRINTWTQPAWADHATINPEGKRTDGLLSLRFHDGVADHAVETVITDVGGRLQQLAPGAEWDVHIRRGATHREALQAGTAAERAGVDLLPGALIAYRPLPAAAAEVPVVRFCDTCGLDSAVVETRRIDPDARDPQAICADCSRRFLEGGFRTDERNWSTAEARAEWQRRIAPGGLGPERKLRAGVAQRLGRSIGVVEDFDDLARLGSGDANHLCTVFVDGNRFGDLLAALKDTDIELSRLSENLAGAVESALVDATSAATVERDKQVCVVPHLVGGDDLLASVTAERAWDFVLDLLDAYHARTTELALHYSAETGRDIPTPTASAGLVFTHFSRPFADSLELAEEALRRAKAQHKGRTPAICWLDVTADGPQLPLARPAPTVDVLIQRRAVLDGLCAVPPSGRAALARALPEGEVAVAALAHRLGRIDAVRPFLLPSAPLPLADALLLGRWWECRRPC